MPMIPTINHPLFDGTQTSLGPLKLGATYLGVAQPGQFFTENRTPNRTKPKPNRIVGNSVFWFGFGFQFCEVRCFGSVSVSVNCKPKYRETKIGGVLWFFFPVVYQNWWSTVVYYQEWTAKLMEYCGLLSRMNCKFVIFDLSIESCLMFSCIGLFGFNRKTELKNLTEIDRFLKF